MGKDSIKDNKKTKVKKDKKSVAKVNEIATNDTKRKRSKKVIVANIFSKFTFKVAMYIVGAIVVIFVCKTTFEFGKDIFSEKGMAEEGQGKEVIVNIPSGASSGEVASILKEGGLIDSELIFRIQTILYEAEITEGTYTLNTEWGPEELIDAMQQVDDEE